MVLTRDDWVLTQKQLKSQINEMTMSLKMMEYSLMQVEEEIRSFPLEEAHEDK